MTGASELAQQIHDLTRRLTAVERTAQLPRTAIDGGQMLVTDGQGTALLAIGDQGEGLFGLQALNGAVVVANDLDLPAGTITETDISDEAISTPKLVANAVTADKIEAGAITAGKIAADAIDGRIIRGVSLLGGELLVTGPDGSHVHIRAADEADAADITGAVVEMGLPADAGEGSLPGRIRTGISPSRGRSAMLLQGPNIDGGDQAALYLFGSGDFGSLVELRTDWFEVYADFITWGIDSGGAFALATRNAEGGYDNGAFTVRGDRLTQMERAEIGELDAGRLTVAGRPVLANSVNISGPCTSGTRTDTVWAAVPGVASFQFFKTNANTYLRTALSCTVRQTAASNAVAVAEFGVRVTVGGTSTDFMVTHGVLTLTNDHLPVAGQRDLKTVGQGTITVQAVWRRVSGSTIAVDSNDYLALTVEEVAPPIFTPSAASETAPPDPVE